MSYEETLAYLYASQPAFHQIGAAAYKPGLDNAIALMNHLGNPQTAYPTIHIAGTNGKGSTSHLIAAALQEAGLRVGLYTSPHLVDFRERIRVNGQMIPEEAVVQYVNDNRAFLDALKPSFFESTMGMAFAFFKTAQVDIAVIEVGLGGRLDSTNIITPWLSVITNIGLDHTEFLGNTLPEIAAEKAGIIKPHVPCVIGESDPLTAPVFSAQAAAVESPITFADKQPSEALKNMPMSAEEGAYQQKNRRTAYVALQVLMQQKHPELALLNEDAIARGFAHFMSLTGLRGRWETLSKEPLVICDTGHNAHGIRTYVDSLRQLHDDRSALYNASQSDNSFLRIVFGMVQDKDVNEVLALLPREAVYYWTQATTHRAIPAEEMRRMGLAHGLIGQTYASVEEAVTVALEASSPRDIVFIGGSNYVVGEALPLFDKK